MSIMSVTFFGAAFRDRVRATGGDNERVRSAKLMTRSTLHIHESIIPDDKPES